MNALSRFDSTALQHLNRALIGFNRISDDFENRFVNSTTNYPPYNVIQLDENNFEIEIAVAGFDKNDITVTTDSEHLVIKGQRSKEDTSEKYIYKGLANRDFEREFKLVDHMQVGEAELTNGMLRVKLTRVIPEALKSRLIAIKG